MKRASLSARPPTPKSEPADLTDRLLEREAERATSQPTPKPGSPRPSKKAKPTAVPAEAKQASTAPGDAVAGQTTEKSAPKPEPESQPAVIEAYAAAENAELDAVLRQAATAADALTAAARQAPARYDVALRYRLDALAHHLRQVADFVASLARR